MGPLIWFFVSPNALTNVLMLESLREPISATIPKRKGNMMPFLVASYFKVKAMPKCLLSFLPVLSSFFKETSHIQEHSPVTARKQDGDLETSLTTISRNKTIMHII